MRYNRTEHTYPAHEALRVPLGAERRYVVVGNGCITTAALGGEQLEVVGATIGSTILFMVAVVAEVFATMGAEKVLRVPRPVQRRYAFLYMRVWDERVGITICY
jgi:hypothetical protein